MKNRVGTEKRKPLYLTLPWKRWGSPPAAEPDRDGHAIACEFWNTTPSGLAHHSTPRMWLA